MAALGFSSNPEKKVNFSLGEVYDDEVPDASVVSSEHEIAHTIPTHPEDKSYTWASCG